MQNQWAEGFFLFFNHIEDWGRRDVALLRLTRGLRDFSVIGQDPGRQVQSTDMAGSSHIFPLQPTRIPRSGTQVRDVGVRQGNGLSACDIYSFSTFPSSMTVLKRVANSREEASFSFTPRPLLPQEPFRSLYVPAGVFQEVNMCFSESIIYKEGG